MSPAMVFPTGVLRRLTFRRPLSVCEFAPQKIESGRGLRRKARVLFEELVVLWYDLPGCLR